MNSTEVVAAPGGKWVKVSGQFVAKYEAEHILIGNFNDDDHTVAISPEADSYNYAYYYIDDVLVKIFLPFSFP